MNAVTAPRPQIMTGGQVAALVPQSLDEAFRVANAIAASGLAPRGLEKPEQVLVSIMAGAELGFAPFQSMQSFAVVNGKPSLWGDAIPALLWSRGFDIEEWFDDEDNATKAFCKVTRPSGKEVTRTFSLGDAKKAGLHGKTGPWQTATKRMLQMRARAFAARDGAADVLRGMQVYEEVQDYQPLTARAVPREGPNLAARLSSPKDVPAEGFTAVHNAPAEDDHIPDFDAGTSPRSASEQPASEASDPSDAGENLSGEREPAEDAKTAGSAEANANEGSGLAVDVIGWADRLIADLPFFTPEQVAHLEQDRKELAKFAVLKATDIDKAKALEEAIVAAKEA